MSDSDKTHLRYTLCEYEGTRNPSVRNALEHGTVAECRSADVQLKLELQKLSDSNKVVA
jgi:hypothetical protein